MSNFCQDLQFPLKKNKSNEITPFHMEINTRNNSKLHDDVYPPPLRPVAALRRGPDRGNSTAGGNIGRNNQKNHHITQSSSRIREDSRFLYFTKKNS